MRTASSAFKEKVKSSSRNFINTAVITLASQEVLTITNANILFDGLEVEDSVGSDNTFDALGSTIINKCTLVLYNGDESYSAYDFDDAKVIVSTGLVINNTTEPIQLGEFTVEEATYTTNSIVLSMLDNMSKFDRPYSESQLVYPATLADIVADVCTTCGVTFNYAGSDFAYDTFSVATKPDGNSCTFRDVIGWAATINGTFARCNSLGQLEFKWFDLSGRPIPTDNITVVDEHNVEHEHVSLVLSDNTLVDTISYLPGKNTSLPEVKSLFSQDIAVTDITITGITITVANIEDGADITSSIGTDDYRIVIADNPFITADNIEDVRDQIADKVLDLSFRKCSVKCVSNPLLEAGDTAYLVDTKGNEHRILLTRVTFSPTANQTIVCGADTPNRKSATLYSASTRTVAQMKSQVRALRDRMANVETIAGDTNQYFWFTETGTDTGAHITEVPQEDFTNPNSQSYHTGFNALFRSIGLAIRNGLTELATFSANSIRLGLANAKHIIIDPDGISLYSAATTLLSKFTTSGITLYDSDGTTEIAKFGSQIRLGKDTEANVIVSFDQLQMLNSGGYSITKILSENTHDGYAYFTVYLSPNGVDTVFYANFTISDIRGCYYEDTGTALEFPTIDSTDKTKLTFATPPEANRRVVLQLTTSDNLYRITFGNRLSSSHEDYVGEGSRSIAIGNANCAYGVESICIGTRNVSYTNYCFGFGEHLKLGEQTRAGKANSQTVLGKYNEQVSQYDYSFVIGNGTSDSDRKNAFVINTAGSIEIGFDTTASSGTIDANLYNAIVALGWENDVII